MNIYYFHLSIFSYQNQLIHEKLFNSATIYIVAHIGLAVLQGLQQMLYRQ